MSRLTKTLTAALGLLVVYGLVSTVAFPRWIEPLLTIDQRIADRQKEYDELRALENRVGRAKEDYRSYVSSVGSFDVGKVEAAIRVVLNELIEKHKLQSASVSPSRPRTDRKTHLTRMQITVTAVGTLESAVEFLKEVAELPQLSRVGNAAIYPASRSRKKQGKERINLRLPIEVLVLPQQKLVGRLDEARLEQPDRVVRHADRDYSVIWLNKPFTERIPLRAKAGRDVRVEQGRSARLAASASGGDGEYTFSWVPPDGLSDTTVSNPILDTSTPITRDYIVTVEDTNGETSTDSVKVTVRKSRRPTRPKKPPPVEEVVKEVDTRWVDRKYRQLCMTLLHRAGPESVSEVMIYNNRAKKNEYFAVGDEFDGGELIYVHPRGGVVRRKDEYFIYPVGSWLDQDVKAGDTGADEYPELNEVVRRLREIDKAGAKDGSKKAVDASGDRAGGTAGVNPPATNDKEGGDAEHRRAKSRRQDAGPSRPVTKTQRGDAGRMQRDKAGAATRGRSQSARVKKKPSPSRRNKSKTRRIKQYDGRP